MVDRNIWPVDYRLTSQSHSGDGKRASEGQIFYQHLTQMIFLFLAHLTTARFSFE